jgi:hypothetical protein
MTIPLTTRNLPTRFPNGVNTSPRVSGMKMLPIPDPSGVIQYFDDYMTYLASDWTITKTSAASTQALVDGDGGLLQLYNPATASQMNAIQHVKQPFTGNAKKKMWFKTKLTFSDANAADVLAGLQGTTATPFTFTGLSGMWFFKPTGGTTFTCYVQNNGTATSQSGVGLATTSPTELIIFYNGKDEVTFWQDGVCIASLASTNFPDTRAMTVSLALRNSAAAAVKSMNIDYVVACKER